jgi:hypothetical protein
VSRPEDAAPQKNFAAPQLPLCRADRQPQDFASKFGRVKKMQTIVFFPLAGVCVVP